TCTRARLSTDGRLYTCLFAERGYDLKALVRGASDDAAIADAVRAIWRRRADRYSEIRTAETSRERKVEMSFIGG
ncbi:MAG: GTP 3',8-cyclase MoaA, partial [Usitatibacter sp.]